MNSGRLAGWISAVLLSLLALACSDGVWEADDSPGGVGSVPANGGSTTNATGGASAGSGINVKPGTAGVAGAGTGPSTGGSTSNAGGNNGGMSVAGTSSGGGAPGCSREICQGECVSIATSPTNCGACGHRCGVGQTCSEGICRGGGDGTCPTVGGGKCPNSVSCPPGMQCGCLTVSGLGANKKAILEAGVGQPYTQYLLASAMMETEKSDTNYPYGDKKTGDGFNAGVAKQNWGMIRACHPAWQNQSADSYATAAAMNSDRGLDVTVYNECRARFGASWWAGHRNGPSGLANPDTQDIKNFKAAADWTDAQIRAGGHQCDDVRFWVHVPAINWLPPVTENAP